MTEYRTAEIPPEPGPRDHVIRVRAGEDYRFICLSRSLWGVWTHWINDRTEPCIVPRDKCRGCQKQAPSRWKGYIHVCYQGKNSPAFLEMTPITARMLLNICEPGCDLRGIVFKIERGRGSKAHMHVGLANVRYAGNDLPQERDPKAVLATLWQMPNRKARFAEPRVELGTELPL